MNRLSTAKRAQIVSMMSEGYSLRAITRMTSASINTVTKLLVDLGHACAKYHDTHVRNVPTKRVEADEVWTFCYARRDNVPDDKRGTLGFGDVWTWVGLDVDSKLVVSWTCGRRDADTAYEFMHYRVVGPCAWLPNCQSVPAQVAVDVESTVMGSGQTAQTETVPPWLTSEGLDETMNECSFSR